MSSQVEVVGLPVRESAVGAEVDESRLERRTRCLSQFDGAKGFELVSRAFAARCDSRAKSSQLRVEFVIDAAHETRFRSSTGATCRRPS